MGVPVDREQYINRLGRTGREGKGGEGILVIAPWEDYFLQELKDLPIHESSSPHLDPDMKVKETILTLQSLPKVRQMDLFDAKYIRPVLIAVGLMVCQQSGGINGIGFYASETFQTAGLSSGKAGTVAYALIQIPVTMLGVVLMDKSGRRALLLVSSSGTFLGCFLAGTSFFFKGQAVFLEWVPLLAVSGVLIFIASFSIGMGAVPWLIMSEDYLNDEHKFNITHRLVLLFPRIDVHPSDGFVTENELTEWNLEQSQKEVLHRSQREMELHDKNHDGLVSFAEYQPPTWVRDSDDDANFKRSY